MGCEGVCCVGGVFVFCVQSPVAVLHVSLAPQRIGVICACTHIVLIRKSALQVGVNDVSQA